MRSTEWLEGIMKQITNKEYEKYQEYRDQVYE